MESENHLSKENTENNSELNKLNNEGNFFILNLKDKDILISSEESQIIIDFFFLKIF